MIYKFVRKDIMGELQTVKEVEIRDVELDSVVHLDFIFEYLKPDQGILIDKSLEKEKMI